MEAQEAIEPRIREVGREIFSRAVTATPGVAGHDWWQGRILDWAMHDPQLRLQLFRFIDALPSLHTAHQVAEHLQAYLGQDHRRLPLALDLAVRFGAPGSLGGRVAAFAARRNARAMARRFIAGETLAEALT